MSKTQVGVVGLGFIGPAHIEALRRLPDVEVAGIADFSAEIAQARAQALGTGAYDSFDDLLRDDSIECVHICTPNFLHYEQSKKALLAGKNVVCEKPLATDIREAEELVELADKLGLVNAVHFNLRYYPLIRQMKTMREKGELGEIYSVQGSYLQDWLFLPTDYNWRLEPSQSGDSRAVADIGSHLFDLVEYITGLHITEVMADFNTVHKTRMKPKKAIATYSGKMLQPSDYEEVPITTEDFASILYRFDNGNTGVATVSQVSAGRKNRCTLEISGAKETYNWCSESPNEMWIGRREGANQSLMRDPALAHEEARALMTFPGGHNEGFPDTSKQLFKEVYAAIRNGKPEKPTYPIFSDGLRELNLCDKIVQSSRERRWVQI
ncbi:MAG: Gfo/Idh/MocA family oxidoreductase [Spirosomataceae bacterium]